MGRVCYSQQQKTGWKKQNLSQAPVRMQPQPASGCVNGMQRYLYICICIQMQVENKWVWLETQLHF